MLGLLEEKLQKWLILGLPRYDKQEINAAFSAMQERQQIAKELNNDKALILKRKGL